VHENRVVNVKLKDVCGIVWQVRTGTEKDQFILAECVIALQSSAVVILCRRRLSVVPDTGVL